MNKVLSLSFQHRHGAKRSHGPDDLAGLKNIYDLQQTIAAQVGPQVWISTLVSVHPGVGGRFWKGTSGSHR
jgi:hypothetical protein